MKLTSQTESSKQLSNQENQEYLRLPSRLRLKFEEKLSGPVKSGNRDQSFKYYFEKGLKSYRAVIEETISAVFTGPQVCNWFIANKIDILTWHYKTRHSADEIDDDARWLSGQVIFNPLFTKYRGLEPFPGKKSPYIGIFADETARENNGMGGPICIVLHRDEDVSDEWNGVALHVPGTVTKILKQLPPYEEGEDSAAQKSLHLIKKKAPTFLTELLDWMNRARGRITGESEALNYLRASLKVTLKLHGNYRSRLPRSTFLCPAYVAHEEVGGMAFACDGVLNRPTVFLGEDISTTMLTYLRLREDALAQHRVEEKEKVDQAKRFLINRFVHDFRHPVESLQSAVKEAKQSLTSIEKQLSHVNRVMNETILAFEGRSPKELLRAKKRSDSVSEFFADIRFFFKKRFEEAGKSLEFFPNPIPTEWTFRIDRGMFHEVMENLLANALEHGGPHVKVEVEKQDQKYVIHVKDDGRGISARERQGIFKAFFKKPTRIKEGRVRGRGMVISKLLVEAHGGTLELGQSDETWKTDFVIEIPA
jgi:signal transduction histidine kinase